MELKSYQQTTLEALRRYLEALRAARAKSEKIAAMGLEVDYEWDRDAWRKVTDNRPYVPRRNRLNQPTPSVCLKVPTGGGKTLLAAHAVGAINNLLRGSNNGLVLWIVPTTQIYRQTLHALRDRAHPYRQVLDLQSGNKTIVIEKDALFTPDDVHEHLVVLLLMLPSASRHNKETLRLFRDRGGFEQFFPAEDRWQEQAALLRDVPNLDTYAADDSLAGPVVKSSLGNTLRLLQPLIILDEGHKAYSATAQETLLGFNPFFVLELSATPPPGSNVLVSISGRDVHRAGMIKLDLNLYNKASPDWRDTVLAAHQKRLALEQLAKRFEANHGMYIRPINLIQVERTGQKQRLPGFIHAEDVREFLITRCNVHPDEIAVKSSEKDEIENIDLLSAESPIRYIITRQALQEGWDCPFAYVLTALTNAEAATGITQLVGRVLRQPYARKTGYLELDESYVYSYSDKTGNLLRIIQEGLQQEGLGDLTGHVIVDRNAERAVGSQIAEVRPAFEQYAGKVYLPCFVVQDGHGGWREIKYEMDVLSRVDWEQVDLSRFDRLQLNPTERQDSHVRVSLDAPLNAIRTATTDDEPLDLVFFTRQLNEIVPNPWVAYDYVREAIAKLQTRYDDAAIRRDQGFVIEELRKLLREERSRLAEQAFRELINQGALRFYLLKGHANGAIPERINVRQGRKLTTAAGDPVQRSLFDYVPEDDFNNTERAVALYLDDQYWVLAWYRNAVRLGYSIQGWREHRIYPDFIVLANDLPQGETRSELSKIHVLETKGLHLKNEDTDYKKAVFDLCNQMSQPTPWDTIEEDFSNHKVHFQVIFEDEWQRVLNALLNE